MNGIRLGRGVRALRHRLDWRQEDLGERADISQDLVSLIERGHIERTNLATLDRLATTLDAELVVYLRWRGGELDRLLDEDHATLVGGVASMLRRDGWVILPEVTYAEFGERGSIDLVAWHEESGTLLIVEVKSALTSREETLRRHDAKVRLAPAIARKELGLAPKAIARLLVLPASTTARRRVARHATVFDAVYPLRGLALRRWLRQPAGRTGGVLFLSSTTPRRGRRRQVARKRVRPARSPSTGTGYDPRSS